MIQRICVIYEEVEMERRFVRYLPGMKQRTSKEKRLVHVCRLTRQGCVELDS